jgi:hypothetical protein
MAGFFRPLFLPRQAASSERDIPGKSMWRRNPVVLRAGKLANSFTSFIDAIFTTLLEPAFTKAFYGPGADQRLLACVSRAPPINSPAT